MEKIHIEVGLKDMAGEKLKTVRVPGTLLRNFAANGGREMGLQLAREDTRKKLF